ncbi:hypothetical protein Y032_0360g3452 [Ancylostoma ceylanicum]|uniref:RxLR effector candidate protein n=1 Tax=Ancylostoma ceylanicum TaxID=53326 RepID=A0A016RVV1_9BILA|nr:hypothetical protein Y032_0360g3452 [Ancylostoma ceylanicum]
MRHFALLLLASSVSSCVRTTPSSETTLSRAKLLESRSQAQQQPPVNLRAAPVLVANSPQSSPTLIRRGSHELRIQEHLALFKQASAKTFRTWNGDSRMKTDEGKKFQAWSSVEKFEPHKNEVLTRQRETKNREEEGSGEAVTTTSTTSTTQITTASQIPETRTQSSQQGQLRLFIFRKDV